MAKIGTKPLNSQIKQRPPSPAPMRALLHNWARTDYTYLLCRRCKITDIEAALRPKPDVCELNWAEKKS